jgi:hypothetical protein
MPTGGSVPGLEPLQRGCARGGDQIDGELVVAAQVWQVKALPQDGICCAKLEA